MRCDKCKFITFDFYDNCPKCGNSFKEKKRKLNLIDYSIKDECNYLIPEPENISDVKNIKKEEIKKPEEPEIEHTKIDDQKIESHIEEDGISISELLETTKIED